MVCITYKKQLPELGEAGMLLLIGPTSASNPPLADTSCITADNDAQIAFSSGNVDGWRVHFLAPPRNSNTSCPDPALKELMHQLLRRCVGDERKIDLVEGWRRQMSLALIHRILGTWKSEKRCPIKIFWIKLVISKITCIFGSVRWRSVRDERRTDLVEDWRRQMSLAFRHRICGTWKKKVGKIFH